MCVSVMPTGDWKISARINRLHHARTLIVNAFRFKIEDLVSPDLDYEDTCLFLSGHRLVGVRLYLIRNEYMKILSGSKEDLFIHDKKNGVIKPTVLVLNTFKKEYEGELGKEKIVEFIDKLIRDRLKGGEP